LSTDPTITTAAHQKKKNVTIFHIKEPLFNRAAVSQKEPPLKKAAVSTKEPPIYRAAVSRNMK
jgi:hypothetical protein